MRDLIKHSIRHKYAWGHIKQQQEHNNTQHKQQRKRK